MKLFHRLRALFRKEELDQELSDELAFHLENQIEQNIAAGMSAKEARYAALKSFGGVEQVKEECRDAWGVRFIDTQFQDIRFGLRMLTKNPGFTAVAVLTLALGIGANSAIFTVVDAAVLRPLPIAKPDRLVRLSMMTPQGANPELSYPDYEDVRQQVKSFSGVTVCYRSSRFLNSLDESSNILVDVVSPDYFTVLGVKPLLGRTFSRQEDSNAPSELGVVISYRLWQGRLGADPRIIGKEIKLTGKTAKVIGVTAPRFQGLERFVPTDIWIPISDAVEFSAAETHSRDAREFDTVARLCDGLTPAQASAELDALGRHLAQAYPETNRGMTLRFTPETTKQGELMPVVLLLMVAVGFVLLIACANVAGLLIARADSRRRELALRVALGAGKWRVLRQFLTEGLLLSVVGGACGLALTSCLMSVQKSLLPPSLSFIEPEMQVDLRVVAFTVGVTLLATLLSTVTPALHAWRIGLANVLKEEVVVRGGRLIVRNSLVAGQIALSVMVVTASLLLFRSLSYVANIPVGFDIHKNLAVVNVFPLQGTEHKRAQFLPRVMEQAAAVPGVVRATYAMRIPLSGSGGGMNAPVSIPGVELPEGQSSIPIHLNAIGPNYFQTVGTRLVKGRDFDSVDGPESQRVVIISQTMARRFWPGGDALGKSIKIDKHDTQIVGIAEDAKIENMIEPPTPYMYLPFAQRPYDWGALIVEIAGKPDTVIPLLRREIHSADPNLVISRVDTPRTLIELSTFDLLMESRLIGVLGLVGVFLASIGLYGVVSFVVGRRTREIGIRMALGAHLRQVRDLILFQGLRIALVGVLVGALAALAACRLMASLLYGVKPYDPVSFAAGAAIVMCVALLACYVPARRATKVDPMVALRYE
jgi:putative ABC transport system permease protein